MPSPSPFALIVSYLVVFFLTASVYLVGCCQPGASQSEPGSAQLGAGRQEQG
ncbi:MAG: hypothetical protein JKY65_31955 [Planctomycetes bacterium]|nr:hypothetical protein [Planctomycetota bacterium]